MPPLQEFDRLSSLSGTNLVLLFPKLALCLRGEDTREVI